MIRLLNQYLPGFTELEKITKFVNTDPSKICVTDMESIGVFLKGFVVEECDIVEFPFFHNYQNKPILKKTYSLFRFHDNKMSISLDDVFNGENNLPVIPNTGRLGFVQRKSHRHMLDFPFIPTRHQLIAITELMYHHFYPYELETKLQVYFYKDDIIIGKKFLDFESLYSGSFILINKYGRISFSCPSDHSLDKRDEVFGVASDKYHVLGQFGRVHEFVYQMDDIGSDE